MTGNALSFALEAFLAGAPELSEFRLKPHGLRAMAVRDQRLDGLSHQEISAQPFSTFNGELRKSGLTN
jgi:hypothetical protein